MSPSPMGSPCVCVGEAGVCLEVGVFLRGVFREACFERRVSRRGTGPGMRIGR